MLKKQDTKDFLFILLNKFSSTFIFISLIILVLLQNIKMSYLITLCIILFLSNCIIDYLNYSLTKDYNIEVDNYKQSLMIEKCSTIEELENLKLVINDIERKIIRNMLLNKLSEMETKINETDIKNEEFNNKIKEARELLENITDKELKIKLEGELALKVKIHFNKYLKNSIFSEN